jgi:hypothetical protein
MYDNGFKPQNVCKLLKFLRKTLEKDLDMKKLKRIFTTCESISKRFQKLDLVLVKWDK